MFRCAFKEYQPLTETVTLVEFEEFLTTDESGKAECVLVEYAE